MPTLDTAKSPFFQEYRHYAYLGHREEPILPGVVLAEVMEAPQLRAVVENLGEARWQHILLFAVGATVGHVSKICRTQRHELWWMGSK
jgi:hypothetical protein